MLRVLVVEDQPNTVDQLKALLQDEFPDAVVDTAQTVNEGMRLIDVACRSGKGYNAAVLDFKLPRRFGDNPEIDETLCGALSLHMPDALIVHISGFGDDPRVKTHLAKHQPRQGYPVLISKLDPEWPIELAAIVRKFVASMRIDGKMDRLLRTPRGGGRMRHDRRADVELPCMTPDLDDLMQDIVAHWEDLDAPLLLRVEQTFEVDRSTTPPSISLRGTRPLPLSEREETSHDS